MQTRRKEMIALLEQQKMTARQLAERFEVEVPDILEDLKHIAQTIKATHKKLKEQWAVCNICGFVFKEREKFSRPSKCPKCRSEGTTEPVFWVE